MARFCTECGKELAVGTAFCTECGAKAPADTAGTTTETVTEVRTEPKVEAKPETAVHTPPTQNNHPLHQTYTQPPLDPTNKVVGTGAYFGLMFLFAIPVIGFIACIIMAFASKNRNIKNFARAILIWTIIGIVLAGILALVITMMMGSITNYINEMTGGQFSEYGGFSDILGQLGELSKSYESIPMQ